MSHDGESPMNRAEARKILKDKVDKEERKIAKGSQRDLDTRDDDILDADKQQPEE